MNAVAAALGAADGAAARAAVISMLDRMPARGAGFRVLVEDPRGVAGASGSSPASSERADGARLVGDVRLDNGAELRRALGLDAGTAHAVAALEAYARWGIEFAARLAGSFAFVIFDPRNGRVVAVRDPLGVRPLYYRRGADDVRLASDLRALVEPGDTCDEGYLAEAIAGIMVDAEGTPFEAIKRLPAAHALVLTTSSERLVRYWEPSTDVLSGSIADHADRFRATFDDAVRSACDGETRVGVHLSGGLDSSSLLSSVMANGFATPIAASNVFPFPAADERAWIDAAAARWSLTPMLISPPVAPAAHDLANISVHRDLPDLPAGGPLFAPLHRALRDEGIAVVLSGSGGDTWWAGETAHMADLLGRLDLGALWRWRQAGAAMGDAAWSGRDFLAYGLLPHVPAGAKRLVRRVWPAPVPPWITPAFANRVSLRDRFHSRPDTRHAPSESWRRMRWRLSNGEVAQGMDRVDRMAVAHGIDIRVPLCDRRLVDLAFVTPDSARLAHGGNRVVMREAMAGRLSAETRSRQTKGEFSDVQISAARAPDVEPHLAFTNLVGRGWIDRGVADSIVDAVRNRGVSEDAVTFWSIVGVEAWLADALR